MKSQDVYILLKLACMQAKGPSGRADYSARGLSAALGVSKSEVNASMRRSNDTGLIARDRITGLPKVYRKALFNFIVHGIRYVFPASPGAIVKGVPTACYAPVFEGRLYSLSDHILVWPFAEGKQFGQALQPLFASAPRAALDDDVLYECLALVDSIRVGQARESNMAAEMLEERLIGDDWSRRAA